MFRPVYNNQMAGMPAAGDVSAMMHPVQQLQGTNAVMQGFPVTLQDGRTVMYCVPTTGSPNAAALGASHPQQQQQQAHFIPFPTASAPQGWPQSSIQGSVHVSQLGADNAANPNWFAANGNGAVNGAAAAAANAAGPRNGGPVFMQTPLTMANFSMEKLPGSMPSQPSSQVSHTTNGLSSPGRGPGATAATNAASNFDASATSVASSGAVAAGGSAGMGQLSPASGMTGFQMPVPLSQAHPTAPPPPQTCFWVNHATGAVTPMRPEEMTATSLSPSTSVPSYSVQPPPPPPPAPSMPMSVPSASASASSAPAFLMAPQVTYGGALVPAFSASLSGATPFALPTLPPPPPPPPVKTLNGLQYQLGELYEGFVKRYNPNRGFGFLTATTHIALCREDASGAAASTPSGSATEMPATTAVTVKEVRTAVHVGDIFVHQSYMHMQGFRTLPVGGRVRFRVGYKDGQQTFQAVEVELLPQVLPPNMEIPAFTTAPSLANTGDATGAGGVMMLPAAELLQSAAPASHMPQTPSSDAPSGVASIRSGGRAVHYTPSDDDGDDEEDQPVIELAFDMYSKFE